jgi:hypothetical protein
MERGYEEQIGEIAREATKRLELDPQCTAQEAVMVTAMYIGHREPDSFFEYMALKGIQETVLGDASCTVSAS